MVFKPFKPPLIRKPPEQPASNVKPIRADNDEKRARPSKRRRLSDEEDSDKDNGEDDTDGFLEIPKEEFTSKRSSSKPSLMHCQTPYRRPLLQVKNGSLEEKRFPSSSSSTGISKKIESDARTAKDAHGENEVYYNVLWCVLRHPHLRMSRSVLIGPQVSGN